MNIPAISTALALAGLLGAQHAIVPAAFAASEAPSAGELAGVSARLRQQFLIAPGHLAGLAGKTLEGMWFRRNGGGAAHLAGGQADLVVELSASAVRPEAAAPAFDANHGATRMTVFRGRTQVPESATIGVDPWAVDQTIRIAFAPAFVYPGGTLCIDVTGVPVQGATSPFWPLDCARADVDGAATALGQHCAGQQPAGNVTLLAEVESLVPGASASFVGFGQHGSLGSFCFGPKLEPGVELSVLGMAGCVLRVDSLLALAALVDGRVPGTPASLPSTADLVVQLPASSALLGARFAAQFADLELGEPFTNPLHVTLSQGLDIQLASTAMTLGLATVTSVGVPETAPLPGTGLVAPNRGPVLRLAYR